MIKEAFIQIFIPGILLLYFPIQINAQSKEWNRDVIYSERLVPDYELPDPLKFSEGERINSKEAWLNEARPRIMELFAKTIYGQVPACEIPIKTDYKILNTDTAFFDGACTRKQILVTFSNSRGKVQMHLALFLPNDADGPVPVLLHLGFNNATGTRIELENIQSYGKLKNGIPLVDFLDRGFGVACIKGGEVVPDENGFANSIHQLYYEEKQQMPHADQWGVLAGIAWQLSRAMDYLETEEGVNQSKVAILGFSKLGKATLWAGALDTRFAMVLSQNSGCAGAALWRRKFGESLKYMSMFPHWLCENSRKYIEREEEMPVDQHMLLACIAPRPLYITSGINDLWADNMGEYLSAYHATPVYELFGLDGQSTRDRPRLNEPANSRALAYSIRSGGHGFEVTDWVEYINFMDFHFNKQGK